MNESDNLCDARSEPSSPSAKSPANNQVFLGLRGNVVALNKGNGQIVWSTPVRTGGLTGSSFVNVVCDGDSVYAYGNGWIHRLDALTGQILWSNGLEGYGYGFGSVCLCGSTSTPDSAVIAAKAAQDRAAHSATAH